MAVSVERKQVETEANRRFKEFGWAAARRFAKEMAPDGGAVYDMVEDADIVQLENPTPGGAAERWEVRVDRYGDEILITQLFYSQAGRVWQIGQTFFFSHEELLADGEIADLARGNDQEAMLLDDPYFNGLLSAFESWPVAKKRVISIEETLPEGEA